MTIAAGGEYDDSEGYFVRPTVLLDDPTDEAFSTEYFEPILAVHVYPDSDYERILDVRRHRVKVWADRRGDRRRPGGRARRRTGCAVRRRKLLRQRQAHRRRGRSAAVWRFAGVGHQRQAGSVLNLLRWTSARSIKETFVPAPTTTIPTWRTDNGRGFYPACRPVILGAARSSRMRRAAERIPVTRKVVDRFVAGETVPEVVGSVAQLRDSGRTVTIDYLGEDTVKIEDAQATVRAYLELLDSLGKRGESVDTKVRPLEVSLKLSALGQALPRDGEKIALENARTICERAKDIGAWVTVDAEDHTTTDSTLSIVRELRTSSIGWVRFAVLPEAHAR